MKPLKFITAVIFAAFVILVTQSVFWGCRAEPNLVIPLLMFLAAQPHLPFVVLVACAFICGYMLDSFSGLPLGLHAFLSVVTFCLVRLTGLRWFLKGPISEFALAGGLGAAYPAGVAALRVLFDLPFPFANADDWFVVLTSVKMSISTAIVAPIEIFVLRLFVRASEPISSKRGASV